MLRREHTENRRASTVGLPYRARVQLRVGRNEVLVKSVRPEYGRSSFRLQFSAGCAVELDPTSRPWLLASLEVDAPDAFLWRAEHLWRVGDFSGAIAALESHLSAWPGPPAALVAWPLSTYFKSDRRKNNAEGWLGAAARTPECYGAQLALVEHDLGALRALAAGHPDHCGTWTRLHPLLDECSPDESLRVLQHLATMDAGFHYAFRHLLWDGRTAEAANLLASVEGRFPARSWPVYARLCLLDPSSSPPDSEKMDLVNVAEACALMEQLALSEPNRHGWDCQSRGHLYRRAGHLDKAVRCYRMACRYAPQSAAIRVRLGDTLVARGDRPRARRGLRASRAPRTAARGVAGEDPAVRWG